MIIRIDKWGQRLGLEEPLVPELDNDPRDGLEDTPTLETFGVVPWDDSVGRDSSEEVEVLLGEASAAGAGDPFIDLFVPFDHGPQDVLGILEELRPVLSFHLFEEHNTCILARRGGSRGVSYI